MLSELRMKLETDDDTINYYQSSNLQGVLMEQIDNIYAEQLHQQGLNPYSQHIEQNGNDIVWVVNTLNKEAYQNMIFPLLAGEFQEFQIEKKNLPVRIARKDLVIVNKQDLLEEFYQKPADKLLHIQFLTPTAFKQQGRYVIMPDLRLIYQSLMNKYSASSDDMEMYDEETLEQMVACSDIVQYRLKSCFFPMEGAKIPAWKGEITIRIFGTDTLARYVRFLVRFGQYSGVGIKTAMGMGAIRLKSKEGTK